MLEWLTAINGRRPHAFERHVPMRDAEQIRPLQLERHALDLVYRHSGAPHCRDEPTLEPTTSRGRKPCSSSAKSTPRWASPFMPPAPEHERVLPVGQDASRLSTTPNIAASLLPL